MISAIVNMLSPTDISLLCINDDNNKDNTSKLIAFIINRYKLTLL